MERTDIPAGLALCRSAGWNQLLRDWEVFLTLDPEGSRVSLDDEGSVVGTVTTIRYDTRFSWIGMVLVDPAHQRKGIGFGLLEQALEILRSERCVKLDATPAGRQVYTKLGFEDEYGLSRMVATSINTINLTPTNGILPSQSTNHPINKSSSRRTQLTNKLAAKALTSDELKQVKEFDRKAFGADRGTLLSWMFEGKPELALTVRDGDQLVGYCFGRAGYRYTHIGPVIARSHVVAKSLVSAALRQCGDHAVVLDVPHHDENWRRWLESVGFTELRSFIRMYKGDNAIVGIPESQYAILGPEFG